MKPSLKSSAACSLLLSVLFVACNNIENRDIPVQKHTAIQASATTGKEEPSEDAGSIVPIPDGNNLPVSKEEIRNFPFFTAPEGSMYLNNPKVPDFDFIAFVTPERIYEVEGKTFRAPISKDRKRDREISGHYLIWRFEDVIEKAGGAKIFEGKPDKQQIERYKELYTYAGNNGSLDVWNNNIANNNTQLGRVKNRRIELIKENP